MILMESIILGPLELRELTLGEQTPYITRVRTVDYANDDDIDSQTDQMKLSIEADIQLDCEQFRMLITTRLFGKGLVYIHIFIIIYFHSYSNIFSINKLREIKSSRGFFQKCFKNVFFFLVTMNKYVKKEII